jgi:hypothetical protein
MNVDVLIDNQHARVKVMQIFDSHSAQTLEGKYLSHCPQTASIFDFAVWDSDVRIPGVMMEKRRANKAYSEIKQQQIDPGLLQQDDEHEGRSAFSAKGISDSGLTARSASRWSTRRSCRLRVSSRISLSLKAIIRRRTTCRGV